MVISCAAVNCTNRQGKVDKSKISFHRFPINNARRLAKWARAVRRDNWTPNKYSFLCSKHFSPDCFVLRLEDQHKQLKAGAVPTVFDFTAEASGAGRGIRKKLLQEDQEYEEEEEEDSHTRSEPCMVISDYEAQREVPVPTVSQQTDAEWSLDEGETFVPSSCLLIDTLHSYCSTAHPQHVRRGPQQRHHLVIKSKHKRRSQRAAKHLRGLLGVKRFRRGLDVTASEKEVTLRGAPLNPAVLCLDWLLGSWESDEPGEGSFPTISPFRYTETLHFSHVGQPVINFMFNAAHAESKKPLHRECGFIRIQPGTSRVAFIIAQNSGVVEIEEGELNGHQLSLQSTTLGRTSFAKEPHVQQVSRLIRLRTDGKLEQTVSMATKDQPLTQHLHVVYRRSSS